MVLSDLEEPIMCPQKKRLRHSLLRCIGDLPPIIELYPLNGAYKKKAKKKPPIPLSTRELPNSKPKKTGRKKKNNKNTKVRFERGENVIKEEQAMGATSSTFMSSSVRAKMTEIDDIDKNYQLTIQPTGLRNYAAALRNGMAPITPAKSFPVDGREDGRWQPHPTMSTPDLFDNANDRREAPFFIEHASYIERASDGDIFMDANDVFETFSSLTIEPAISPTKVRVESESSGEKVKVHDAQFVLSSDVVSPIQHESGEEDSDQQLMPPPSTEILRLRSGRTINRYLRNQYNDRQQCGSFEGQKVEECQRCSEKRISFEGENEDDFVRPLEKDISFEPEKVDKAPSFECEKMDEYVCDLEKDTSSEIEDVDECEDKDNVTYSSSDEEATEDSASTVQENSVEISAPVTCQQYARSTALFLNPEILVYAACGQKGPIQWTTAFSKRMIEKCVKIGEGSFGEVFRSVDESDASVALKVIPIGGDLLVNGDIQKSFAEILPEIKISRVLSELRNETQYTTLNFVEVKKVHCVCGRYPERLLQSWDEYDTVKGSENDRPSMFDQDQLYIVLVFGDGGADLESVTLRSVSQAESIVKQLVLTLAIAEVQLEFEHRDLHIGNVLVKETSEKEISYVFDGKRIQIETHGVHVFIIDFTNSRLIQEGVYYTNLARDTALFRGEGDYQFDIYRKMRDLNGNEWKSFRPKSNLFWMDYLLDKLITFKRYGVKRKMTSKQANPFLNLRAVIEHFDSCHDLVSRHGFFYGLLFGDQS